MPAPLDLLQTLTLRDRYERLVDLLGEEVANLLVPPDNAFIRRVELFATDVQTRSEGILIPIWGPSGSGKTTLVMNLQHWLPISFTSTFSYNGPLVYDQIHSAVLAFEKQLPADNTKIIPVNFDHRENDPPSDREISAIKRFLRENSLRAPAIIFWPETQHSTAQSLAGRYIKIAGNVTSDIPLECRGPPSNTWQSIAIDTLKLCNQMESLEDLGVDPKDYRPSQFESLGHFLRQISQDFNKQIRALRDAVEKPLTLIIGFVSATPDPGILSQLTNSSRYALLDGHALVAVTRASEMGKWWSDRPGLLTRTIVQLNAHAVSITPATSISCIRNIAQEDEIFKELGYRRQGPHQAARDLARSDLGKLLKRDNISRFEARGVPAEKAAKGFEELAGRGFTLGKDRNLNATMAIAINALLEQNSIPVDKVTSEQQLEFCKIIPDNAVHAKESIVCIEYTWRKGDFLVSGNRSTVAQYILRKLQTYARQLRWTSD